MDLSRVIPPFRCNDVEKTKLHKEWEVWKRSLEYYFEAEDIIDQKKKRAKLLHLGGPQLQALFQSLPDSEKFASVAIERQYYDVAVQAFDEFFRPGRQDVLERHHLRRMKQREGERFAEFVIRIRQQISECGVEKYGPEVRKVLTTIMLTDTIVEGCLSEELRKQILQRDRSIEEIEEIGKSLEGVQKQMRDFGATREEAKFGDRVFGVRSKYKRSPHALPDTHTFSRTKKPEFSRDARCFKCGFFGHISTDSKCPARGKVCKRCKRTGHFEIRCRQQNNNSYAWKDSSLDSKKVRIVQRSIEGDDNARESNAIADPEQHSYTEQKTFYAFYFGNDSNVIRCRVGNVEHPMLVDSGAEANLITEEAWKKLKLAGIQVKSCEKGSNRILKSYANNIPLTLLGTFTAEVRVGSKKVNAEFFVVEGGQRSLLGDKQQKSWES
ncbi:uncharacterized protein LOC129761868 [Toxorhynchites rutilus septentrionalis]|uniref:uncharacterized protein LOC129761868 n=1 Tax=Toxorhynchites rutilus septentrionalis TaxID=329112 RepID=UPI002479B8CF|nr:uncharacterized protein LOC129761868 [Toxorhynchites rutilus septentrionalis]